MTNKLILALSIALTSIIVPNVARAECDSVKCLEFKIELIKENVVVIDEIVAEFQLLNVKTVRNKAEASLIYNQIVEMSNTMNDIAANDPCELDLSKIKNVLKVKTAHFKARLAIKKAEIIRNGL